MPVYDVTPLLVIPQLLWRSAENSHSVQDKKRQKGRKIDLSLFSRLNKFHLLLCEPSPPTALEEKVLACCSTRKPHPTPQSELTYPLTQRFSWSWVIFMLGALYLGTASKTHEHLLLLFLFCFLIQYRYAHLLKKCERHCCERKTEN